MSSTKRYIMVLLTMVAAAFTVVGCGPSYPNCETDEHCEETGEVCVDKLCKECASDSQCTAKDACSMCGPGNSC